MQNVMTKAWSIAKNTMDYAKQVKGTLTKPQAVELVGTEKQVEWANKIRYSAQNVLRAEVLTEEFTIEVHTPGRKPEVTRRDVARLFTVLKSEEAIAAYFDDMKSRNLPESRLESAVVSMNNMLDRYARFVEVMSNTDAKFWIDNRDNQPKNHMFKLFVNYVNTGVKTF